MNWHHPEYLSCWNLLMPFGFIQRHIRQAQKGRKLMSYIGAEYVEEDSREFDLTLSPHVVFGLMPQLVMQSAKPERRRN